MKKKNKQKEKEQKVSVTGRHEHKPYAVNLCHNHTMTEAYKEKGDREIHLIFFGFSVSLNF